MAQLILSERLIDDKKLQPIQPLQLIQPLRPIFQIFYIDQSTVFAKSFNFTALYFRISNYV